MNAHPKESLALFEDPEGGKMGIEIGRFCLGKMGFEPHWDRDLVPGNGNKIFRKKKMGMEFDNCEVGFGKNMNWEMGLVPPFRILYHATQDYQRLLTLSLYAV